MKKIGVVTINGYKNFGNRLQNYALLRALQKMGHEPYNIWKADWPERFTDYLKSKLVFIRKYKRLSHFYKFNKLYIPTKYVNDYNTVSEKFDYFILGSDQVWNYTFDEFDDGMFLGFSPKEKNIAYAASFGVSNISRGYKKTFINGINNFTKISVRENEASELIKLINNSIPEIVLDPTLLLGADDWERILSSPSRKVPPKYVLLYFLGKQPEGVAGIIDFLSKEYNCSVINLLDSQSPFYCCGPDEFLFLEKNAFFICTDSFHSMVFALLFNIPFIVFSRFDKGIENMDSRIKSFLKLFNLENCWFHNDISSDILNVDYSYAYCVLDEMKEKSLAFLKNAIQ